MHLRLFGRACPLGYYFGPGPAGSDYDFHVGCFLQAAFSLLDDKLFTSVWA